MTRILRRVQVRLATLARRKVGRISEILVRITRAIDVNMHLSRGYAYRA